MSDVPNGLNRSMAAIGGPVKRERIVEANRRVGTEPGKPAPSPQEVQASREAVQRRINRRKSVRVKVSAAEGSVSIEAPHSDELGWVARLDEAFGTATHSFGNTQLLHLARMVDGAGPRAESEINSMLAAVEGVRPENEVEGMLATQMAATHQAAMQCLGRIGGAATPEQIEAHGTLANKLLRTYTMQIEALAKLRRGGEQRVTVEHVHVYEGGQAIVGNVEHGGNGGGRRKNGHHAQAALDPRALVLAPGAAVLREDPERVRVPVAEGEGQGPVPDARRRKG